MGVIDELCKVLKKEENGDRIAAEILDWVYDEEKRNIFLANLISLKKSVQKLSDITLTDSERVAYEFLIKNEIVKLDDLSQLSKEYPMFKHKSHRSKVMNSLVEKGLAGKIKKKKEDLIYATPKEAVMQTLKEMGKLPRECDPDEVAERTGMPLPKVLEILNELEP